MILDYPWPRDDIKREGLYQAKVSVSLASIHNYKKAYSSGPCALAQCKRTTWNHKQTVLPASAPAAVNAIAVKAAGVATMVRPPTTPAKQTLVKLYPGLKNFEN